MDLKRYLVKHSLNGMLYSRCFIFRLKATKHAFYTFYQWNEDSLSNFELVEVMTTSWGNCSAGVTHLYCTFGNFLAEAWLK